jgi:CRP-like cAMP-binding protein
MLLNLLIHTIEHDETNRDKFMELFQEKEIASKTTLLKEGEISNYMYFIKKGCLRLWFNNEGDDITFQFFFEDQGVSSFESFFERKPSLFTLESIEPATVVTLTRTGFDLLVSYYPELKDEFYKILIQRMGNYAKLFLSRIKNNPQERYQELLHEHPEILQRVAQHYIASYLGITPISLSRIKNRK